jgi:tRNA (guanine-N7-)-methyltransferase
MSFGLSRGRELEPGFTLPPALAPLPDDLLSNRKAAHVDVRAWYDDPTRPFELEIGSGKGTFLVQEAARRRETNFLGIEYAMEFYRYAADRIRRAELRNVRMLGLDAAEFVHWRVPDGVCDVVHLYFADPWPKTKHHRRRMIQDRFLADCTRIIRPGGELRVVTDHDDYWTWMERHFDRWTGAGRPFAREEFKPVMPPRGADEAEGPTVPGGQGDGAEVAAGEPSAAALKAGELVGTNFERKYRAEGRGFHATTLRLVAPDAPKPA